MYGPAEPHPWLSREHLPGVRPCARWGSRQTILAAPGLTNEARLVQVELAVAQSVAICCLPDPGGGIVTYRISYGTSGGRRVSALLQAGTYIAGGEVVTVDAVVANAAANVVAEAFAWVCYAAPTVP